jgi:hypothetical protein
MSYAYPRPELGGRAWAARSRTRHPRPHEAQIFHPQWVISDNLESYRCSDSSPGGERGFHSACFETSDG